VTRAEAAFLARVPLEEIDRWVTSGRLATRSVGANVFVDLSGLGEPVPIRPPVEARSVRDARARSDRALPASAGPRPTRAPVLAPLSHGPLGIVTAIAGATTIALLVVQVGMFGRGVPAPTTRVDVPTVEPVATTPAAVPVGRDPFASPFGATGTGEERGGVLVKPPGVVREGEGVAAATTVVNRSADRWLPPSDLTFVARDETGRVIARSTTTVSLGPGRARTIVAPDLGVDAASIAAIEAHIDPARLRERGFRKPGVGVSEASVTDDGKAIEGALVVGQGAGRRAALSCAMYDTLDELVAVSTTGVDLTRAREGRLRFWLTARPRVPGPYRVACSVS
jgi:hypothetical protein